ncbi:hypothetical protein PR202_gb22015 [Eleusine coracana subsp. coracana]|uniref:Plant heme peroxidase family profile domain-containing protein n=1 Tax=Eleusine coracana subsp. coracana TaxID=191504 RepID=A0AAV5FEN4_ELECO|nr:hypothetical protein PR202_gb22015 [Eleusine coracana subsp. coracana]
MEKDGGCFSDARGTAANRGTRGGARGSDQASFPRGGFPNMGFNPGWGGHGYQGGRGRARGYEPRGRCFGGNHHYQRGGYGGNADDTDNKQQGDARAIQLQDSKSKGKKHADSNTSTRGNTVSGAVSGSGNKRAVFKLTAPGLANEDDPLDWEGLADGSADESDEEVDYGEQVKAMLPKDKQLSLEESLEVATPTKVAASVAELAAIPEVSTPSRRSKRRAGSADQDMQEQAERLKAARNMEKLPEEGILLGNDATSINNAIDNIKDLEKNRLIDGANVDKELTQSVRLNTSSSGIGYTTKTNIDSTFRMSLRANCPATASNSNTNPAPLDTMMPNSFDNAYFSNVLFQRRLLHSQTRCCSTAAAPTKRGQGLRVQRRGVQQRLHHGNDQPKTGSQAQIRLSCSRVN